MRSIAKTMHETVELPEVAARRRPASRGSVTRTLVILENSNCTWCHNAMLATLREKKGVHRVRSEFSSGCLIIEHENEPDALLALIATAGHAVAVAGNGEREMVLVGGHEVRACQAATDILEAPLNKESRSLAAMKPDGSDDCSSTPRSPSHTSSLAVPVCPVCGGPVARDEVRVLTRERPTPGLVLRAMRFVMRTYRVASGLTMASR
jgi:hypothetical protein